MQPKTNQGASHDHEDAQSENGDEREEEDLHATIDRPTAPRQESLERLVSRVSVFRVRVDFPDVLVLLHHLWPNGAADRR